MVTVVAEKRDALPVLTPEEEEALLGYLAKGTGYGPNPSQAPIVLSPWRHNLVTGGGRSGKSAVAAWYLEAHHYLAAERIRESGAGCLYWLMGEDYQQVEKEYEYLVKFYANVGMLLAHSRRLDPGRIELKDGTLFKTISAKDEEKIGRESPDVIAVCEAGLVPYGVFLRNLERVSGSGGKVFMSGTIERKHQAWYVKQAQAWQFGTRAAPDGNKSWRLPTWTNTKLYPGGRNDPQILALAEQMPDDYFLERMAGIPAPPHGIVMPEIKAEIHVRPVEYVPGEPVYIAEDPGYSSLSPHVLEMCQIINGQIRWFDEVYVTGKTTEVIIDSVRKGRPWWKDVRGLVSDPHYKDAHHSMNSVAEVWFARTSLVARGERVHIDPGVETFRTYIKPDVFNGESPMVFSPRCKGLLAELGLVPNADGEMAPFMHKLDAEGNPIPGEYDDKNLHAIKAIWYFLVEHFGYTRARRRRAPDTYVRIG